jgi:hypothetical protein
MFIVLLKGNVIKHGADSFRIETICSSLNRFLRMGPSSGSSVYPEKIPACSWSSLKGAGQVLYPAELRARP